MIRLSLIGVRVEVPTNQPIVLLREEGGTRFLPIFIGSPEATAIVYALQGMETPRPMTHDLFKTVLDDLSVKVERVEITALHDGTFYAEIEFDKAGTKSRISSRPSDAIALAVRMECPIFVADEVLEKAGVLPEKDDEEGGTPDEDRLAVFRDLVNSLDLPDLPDEPPTEPEGGASN